MLPKNHGYQRTLRPKRDIHKRLAAAAAASGRPHPGGLYQLAGNTTGSVTNLINGKKAPSIEAVASIAYLHAERLGNPDDWAAAVDDLFDNLTLAEAAERDAETREKSAA